MGGVVYCLRGNGHSRALRASPHRDPGPRGPGLRLVEPKNPLRGVRGESDDFSDAVSYL